MGLCVLVAASATIEEAVGVTGIVAGPLLGALRAIRAVLQARHDAVHVGSIASTDILHCDLDAAVVALAILFKLRFEFETKTDKTKPICIYEVSSESSELCSDSCFFFSFSSFLSVLLPAKP